jgi:hypothetical protein
MARPNVFVVTSGQSSGLRDDDHDSVGMPSRQDSLLPGQIHNPTMQPPTPFLDWTRGESQLWDTHHSDGGGSNGVNANTGEKAGYDIWGSSDSNLGVVAAASAAPGSSHHNNMPAFRQSSSLFSSDDAADDDGGTEASEALLPQAVAEEVSSSSSPPLFSSQQQQRGDGRGLIAQLQHQHHLQQRKEASEMLSEELHRQARLFPPPPPLLAPMESRRSRADLWYFHAAKWDITMRLPPPPRNPLAGMEEEHRLKLQELSKVPYRGDRWMARCEFWHNFVQSTFDYGGGDGGSHQSCPVPTQLICEQCVLE